MSTVEAKKGAFFARFRLVLGMRRYSVSFLMQASAWTQRIRVTHGGSMDRQTQKAANPSHGVPPASPTAKGKTDTVPLTPKPGISSCKH